MLIHFIFQFNIVQHVIFQQDRSLTFSPFRAFLSHGRSRQSRRSFLISHLLLSLLTRTEMPIPQVREQGDQGVVWTKQFFFQAKGGSL